MDKLSYHRHRYPSIVIQQAIWLYFRFALSYRDVEDMVAERDIDVSNETVRRWALKFRAIIEREVLLSLPSHQLESPVSDGGALFASPIDSLQPRN